MQTWILKKNFCYVFGIVIKRLISHMSTLTRYISVDKSILSVWHWWSYNSLTEFYVSFCLILLTSLSHSKPPLLDITSPTDIKYETLKIAVQWMVQSSPPPHCWNELSWMTYKTRWRISLSIVVSRWQFSKTDKALHRLNAKYLLVMKWDFPFSWKQLHYVFHGQQ